MILFCSTLLMAENNFESWQKQETQSFQTFQSNEDKAFIEHLKEWEWYIEGISPKIYSKPKPQTQPIIKPFLVQTKPSVIKRVKPLVQDVPTIPKLLYSMGSQHIEVDFFGQKLSFAYPQNMSGSLLSLSTQTISKFWQNVTQQNYHILVDRIKLYQKEYHLNGWATYLLVSKISQHITQEPHAQTALKWFLLIKIGIDAKVGISQEQLVLMVHSSNLIYATRYFTLNHKHYFVLDGSVSTTKLQIYKRGNSNLLALNFMEQPRLKQSIKERIIKFTFQNRFYNIPFYYNQNLVNFYKTYPQIPYNYYTRMNLSTQSKESLDQVLKPIVEQMSQLDAINFLLRLTQNGFRYKRDHAQFGKEKVMFFEETLAYEYSDCEDRAIFFTYLVKKLLHLNIIFIKYPNHLATAIELNTTIKGESLIYKNKRYYIADPTYSGSNIGRAMPKLQGQNIKIIEP